MALVSEVLRFPTVRHLPSSAPARPANSSSSSGVDDDDDDDPFSACGNECAGFTTPAVLAQRYGFDGEGDAVAPGNAMSVAEFQLQYYDRLDLVRFGAQCGVDSVGVDKVRCDERGWISVGRGLCVKYKYDKMDLADPLNQFSQPKNNRRTSATSAWCARGARAASRGVFLRANVSTCRWSGLCGWLFGFKETGAACALLHTHPLIHLQHVRTSTQHDSLLDIQYINAAAPGVPLSVYYAMQYSILDWIGAVNDNAAPELVHSVSYGNDEAQQVSADYMESVNVEFMKAGCRGLSIFIASGALYDWCWKLQCVACSTQGATNQAPHAHTRIPL